MDLPNNKIYAFHNGKLHHREIRFKFTAVLSRASRVRLFRIPPLPFIFSNFYAHREVSSPPPWRGKITIIKRR